MLSLLLGWGGVTLAAAPAAEPAITQTRQWAERAFAAQPVALEADQLLIVHEDTAGDTKINHSGPGGPLRLGEKTYTHGLGTNSTCILRVNLARPAERFVADIGIDRNADHTAASLRFHVSAGGKELFATDVLRPDGKVYPIDVALNGARSFELTVDDGGDGRGWDQADWCDPRVVLQGGGELRLDEIITQATPSTDLPFSFVYGGRPSSEFLAGWKRELKVEKVGETEERRTLTLTDPQTGLEASAVCTVYSDAPGADWTMHFTNRGTTDSLVLEQVRALDTRVLLGLSQQTPTLYRLTGSVAQQGDWLPLETPVNTGDAITFAPNAGRSSAGACPFFHLAWPGGGVVTAIGWTGQWTATVDRKDSALHVAAGMQNLHLRLKPGESIRTPRIMQVYYSTAEAAGGDDPLRPYNLFRQTMFAHIVPKIGGQTITPPIAHMSTAFYETDRGTEADVLSYLKSIEGLGFECFWLDAYYGKDDFPAIGNYVLPLERSVNLKRFPRGLKPIGEAVHQAGLQFLLWMEPERVTTGTLMATEHPDMVVMPGNGGWGIVDLGRPAAREYVTKFLMTAIKDYGVDCWRVDNASDFASNWALIDQPNGPDRVGLAEIRYVEGLYQMWDELLAANPHLYIDNCAAGGQRIDLETCSRSIPLWRTDGTIEPLLLKNFNEAALRNQVMTAGLSRYVPLNVSGMMGAAPYYFRSGFNGGISFAEDVRPEGYPREELKAAIAEGKRLRQYFLGDFYPLTVVSTKDDTWSINQYHRPAEGDGMVMAFRRPRSMFNAFTLQDLRGIDPAAEYELTESHDYTPSAPLRLKGAELLRHTVSVPECPGSVVVEYRKVQP